MRPYSLAEEEIIQEWLFGQSEPKFLNVLELERSSVSYLCFLRQPSKIIIGGRVFGWRFTLECVAPYAFTDIFESRHEVVDEAYIDFHNMSSIHDYLYPYMEIELQGNSTFVSIWNRNDNNRLFQVLDVRMGDTIKVDNKRQIMTAASGDNVFQNFNLNWLRFGPGHSRLHVGNSCIITLRTRFAKAIGGV